MTRDPLKMASFGLLGGALALVVGVAALSTFLNDDDRVRRVLADTGYTEVELIGRPWVGCKDETFATSFKAAGPTGRRVTGVVCSEWGGSATIRLF